MASKKSSTTQPTRRRRAVRYVAERARRYYSSRGGARGIVGSLMPIGVGAAGQIAAQVGNRFMAPWGGIGAMAAVGYFGKNETLMTLAGMAIGGQLPVAGLLGGTTNGSGGGTGI